MAGDLQQALAAIDEANSVDPKGEALVYGQRMSEELAQLFPGASEILQIAARGQHIERWLLPRSDYPEGKEGYLAWRREQARRHGERVAGIMERAGYDPETCARVGTLLRKEGLKRDAEVQALEDVACFVFLRYHFPAFAATRDPAEVADIVRKTARKMSPQARDRVLVEFALPEPLAAAFRNGDSA